MGIMKTGILTFHNANNYGAVLQAYALAEWLMQNGIEPEIINYQSKVFDKYEVFRKKRYKKSPYLLGVDAIKCAGKRKRNKNFEAFRAAYLPISPKKRITIDDFEGITEQYDRFICGSDQIWNPELTYGVDPIYFLDFVTNHRKKVAFSPSVALKRLTEFQIEKITRYMNSFAALSLREQETIDILQPYCERDIMKTCDPVFMPRRACYDRICTDKYADEKFLFLYVIGRAARYKNVISFAEKKARELDCKLYYLIDGDKMLYHIQGINVYGCKPGDFLSLVKNAACVISNSFHASAFSILYEKQFVTFLKDETGSRMLNLLRDFRLEDRVFDEKRKADIFEQKIDYTGFEQRLQTYRQSSEDYLLCALGLRESAVQTSPEAGTERRLARRELEDFVGQRKKCFLARHMDPQVVADSRSGGVFTALSDWVLSNGGAVYGCRMETVDRAIHQRALTREERDLFRGSKYLQSEMGDCFKQVREDLKNGLPVLFSGTGCQVAGLYGFLQGADLANLYTVDIVCHGVPSQRIWKEYLNWMSRKYGSEITSVNFRDKRYGWKAHLETVRMGNRLYASSTYRKLFLGNAFLRPSCYECPFSTLRRKSDITIGDAWGVEKSKSPLNDNKGCSIVLPNSEKGRALLERTRSSLILEEINLEEYLQPNLYKPSNRPANRDRYWNCLETRGFSALVKRYGKAGILRRMKDGKLILKTNLCRKKP